MISKRFRLMAQLLWPIGMLLFGMACNNSGCSCMAPLKEPMLDSNKVYDGIQARISPKALRYFETNLKALLDKFFPNGLPFTIPAGSQQILPGTDVYWCQPDLKPCNAEIEILGGTIGTFNPDSLKLQVQINVTGQASFYFILTLECLVPIHIQNKTVTAYVVFKRDSTDNFIYVDVPPDWIDFSLQSSDLTVQCPGQPGWVNDFIRDSILIPKINGVIKDTINSQVPLNLAKIFCLPCNFYSGGCPGISQCGTYLTGQYCLQSGQCRKRPAGFSGNVDLAGVIGNVPWLSIGRVDLFGAWAQRIDPVSDGISRLDGLDLRIAGGANAERSNCVTKPSTGIPSNSSPARNPVDNTIPGKSWLTYMAGVFLSDTFIDWAIYKAYLAGFLCIAIGTETSDLISSEALSLMGMGSLNQLTSQRNVAVKMRMHPNQVPYVEIGAGTFTSDGKIDDALIKLYLNGLALDFYVLLDQRWTRFISVKLDLLLPLGVELTGQNELIPMLDEEGFQMNNIAVTEYELLAEDPTTLEQLLPTLVEMFLPKITEAIQPIAIPPIDDFFLKILAIQGDKYEGGHYAYASVYADLEFRPDTILTTETSARVLEVRAPLLETMSARASDRPSVPEILLEVSAETISQAEYSYRVDGGFWRPFRPGPILEVRSPVLLLPGQHIIEVRAREIGNYRSLDPTPVQLAVDTAIPD